MQMEFQCVVGNKFINKQPLGPSDAVSNQRNKMLVMDTANYLNFSLEFTLPLPASSLQLLHCHLLAVGKNSSVHISKSSLSKEVGIREAISCACQLLIRECALRETQ